MLRIVKSAADICVKLGFATTSSDNYKTFVSKVKRTWLRQRHADLIVRPVALSGAQKIVEWETRLRTMYADLPAQWALEMFENPAERRECATQFLILQTKKVRQDMKEEAKKASKAAQATTPAAFAKCTKCTTVAVIPTASTSPLTPETCRTCVNPRNPVAPPRTRRTLRSPLANRPTRVASSFLAIRDVLTTRKRARFDDNGEVPRSPSRPPTKWQ